jgi:hypothetical protein
MHHDFARHHWALLPDPPESVAMLTKELCTNAKRPYHLLKDLSEVCQT